MIAAVEGRPQNRAPVLGAYLLRDHGRTTPQPATGIAVVSAACADADPSGAIKT